MTLNNPMFRTNIGLTNSNIGVLAFRNPPSNLTSAQQQSVRTAIGAGTGSGTGSTTFTGLTDTPASLGTAGQYIRVNTGATALEFVAAPTGGGGGATTFEALTDTPASLGSAGQYLRVNSAGTALEFVAAPTGGGGSNFLPSADNRSADGGFYYMGWTDDFSSSHGGFVRVSLSDGTATTATVSNNSTSTTLAAAWTARTTLTYA